MTKSFAQYILGIVLVTALGAGECSGALAVADPLDLGYGLSGAEAAGWQMAGLFDLSQCGRTRTTLGLLGELSPTFPASSSSSIPLNDLPEAPADGEDDSPTPSEVVFIASQASPGGSASGTPSSMGGSGGTSGFTIYAGAAVTLFDRELVAWVDGEQRCALPVPPGNDLLRPPQHS